MGVPVSSYISPKAVKGLPSSIEGRGLVAAVAIARDEIVAIKGGHIVDAATLKSLPEPLGNSDVQIADGFHLVALEEAQRWLCRKHRPGGHARCRCGRGANDRLRAV